MKCHFIDRTAALDREQDETAWDILERFGLALQQCEQAREQVRLALEAVRDALEADVVFCHPGQMGDTFLSVGPIGVAATWAAHFVEQVSDPSGSDRIVRHFLDPGAKPIPLWPTSAALVRISRSRQSWLVALSFHPRRLFSRGDVKVMALAQRMLVAQRQRAQTFDHLRDALFGLVHCLSAAIDARDPFTAGHSERVARMAVRLGKQLALSDAVLGDLHLAGLLHDIGKIGIRDSVLHKSARLTDEERDHLRQHPILGDRLLANIGPLAHLRAAVRHHHERWDGQGYPDGLAGVQIPLAARILAIVDACDAMMVARPYRPALPAKHIESVLADGAGSQWDPELIDLFMTCRSELYSICQRGLGDSVVIAVERVLQAEKKTG